MADLATIRRTGRNPLTNQPPVDPNSGNFVPPPPPATTPTGAPSTIPPNVVINNTAATASSINRLQYPQEDMKYFLKIGIGEYQAFTSIGGIGQRSSLNTDTMITLPIPDQIVDQQAADWIEDNLLQEAFKAAGGIVGTVLAARSQSVLTAASGTLAAAVGAGTIGTIAGIATRLGGYAPNQFITILYSGPKYKQHTFSWTFSPKTPEEAEALRKILQILNNRQAPGLKGNILWSFPSVFWLTFCPDVGDHRNTYLYEFKPAVLVNMAIDYAGGHTPSFRRKDSSTNNKNPPQSIRLSMQFLEIEYWVNGDYGAQTSEGRTVSGRDIG